MTKGMTTGGKSVWGYALIFVVCLASFSWAEEADQSVGLLEQGNRLIEEKKFEEAIGCFDRILEADPENVEALLARTDANIDLERWDAAIKDCSRILRIDRQNVKALLTRAAANINLKRWNFVIQDCDRILKIEPEKVQALLIRTEANVNLKKWEPIIRDCNRVLEIDSRNGTSYRRRGLAKLEMNDPKLLNEVITDLQKAVEFEPQKVLSNNSDFVSYHRSHSDPLFTSRRRKCQNRQKRKSTKSSTGRNITKPWSIGVTLRSGFPRK